MRRSTAIKHLEEMGDAATELRSSWDALVKALREDCPDSDTGS